MIVGKNGFGNDSYCVLLTHANGESIQEYGGEDPEIIGYIMESSNGGEQHICYLMNYTDKISSDYVFGGESWDMTGTTLWKYLSCTGNTGSDDWDMGTNDFCIDFRVKIIDLIGKNSFGSNGVYQDNSNYWGFVYDNGLLTDNSGMTFIVKKDGVNELVVQWYPDGEISYNTWYHCALTRKKSTFRLFWDGELKADEITLGFTMPNFDEPYLIGSGILNGDSSSKRLNAYYDEFRISKGICRWDKNFILPNREY